MENIAAVRPNMAVLDQNKLMLSPFGALSHALAEEILARTGQAEGVYPYVPLELLSEPEPESGEGGAGGESSVNVEVKLSLELPREAEGAAKRTETVERIVERIIRIHEHTEGRQSSPGQGRAAPQTGESRLFFQNINQHISFPVKLQVSERSEAAAMPGSLAKISERFAENLRVLREEGLYPERDGEQIFPTVSGKGEARWIGAEAAETRLNTSGGSGTTELTERAAAEIARRAGERVAGEVAGRLTELAGRLEVPEGESASAAGEDVRKAEADRTNTETARAREGKRGHESAETGETSGKGAERRTRESRTARDASETETVGERPEKAGGRATSGAEGSGDSETAQAIPLRGEARAAIPEELVLAPEGTERSGEAAEAAGREGVESAKRESGRSRSGTSAEDARSERAGRSARAPESRGAGVNGPDEDTESAESGERAVSGRTGETTRGNRVDPDVKVGSEIYAKSEEDRAPEAVPLREELRRSAPEELAYRAETSDEGETAQAIPLRGEARAAVPEELVLAPEGTERSVEAAEAAGREGIQSARRESGRSRSGTGAESAGIERAGRSAETRERRGAGVTETEDTESAESAEETVSGRIGEVARENRTDPDVEAESETYAKSEDRAPEAVPLREELRRSAPEELAYRAETSDEGETAQAIPLRGEARIAAPEKLVLAPEGAERSIEAAEATGREGVESARRESGRSRSGTGADDARSERAGRSARAPERRGAGVTETEDTESAERAVSERTGEAVRENRADLGVEAGSEIYAKGEDRAPEAVPLREELRRSAPEELAYRAETSGEGETAQAISLRGEARIATPEELVLAPEGTERSVEAAEAAGRESVENTRRESGRSRSGTGAEDARSERAGRSAEMREDRRAGVTETEDTENAESGERAASERTGEAARGNRADSDAETGSETYAKDEDRAPEAVPLREELRRSAPEELAYRAEASDEGETAQAIPLRGETKIATPEELVLAPEGAERSVEAAEAAGREGIQSARRESGRSRSGTGAEDARSERAGRSARAPESRGAEATGPDEDTGSAESGERAVSGRTGEVARGNRADLGEEAGSETYAKDEGRAPEAVPLREELRRSAPEELVLAPDGNVQSGEAEQFAARGEVRGSARHTTGRSRSGDEAGSAAWRADTREGETAQAIPLRGEARAATPEELVLAPDGNVQSGEAERFAARGEVRGSARRTAGRPRSGDEAGSAAQRAGVREGAGPVRADGAAGEKESGLDVGREVSGRTGDAASAARETRTASGGMPEAETDAGSGEALPEAIPLREELRRSAPEELAYRAETSGEDETAQAIPLRGEARAATPEDLIYRADEDAQAGMRPGDTARRAEELARSTAGRRGDAGREFGARESSAATANIPAPVELAGVAGEPAGGPETSGARIARPGREEGPTTGSVNGGKSAGRTGRAVRATYPVSRPAQGGELMMAPPVELTYNQPGNQGPAERQEIQPSGNGGDSEYIKSLPDWARRFLKEGAGSLGTAGSITTTAAGPELKTTREAAKGPQMVEWTAPSFHQPPPAETQYRELRPPEDLGSQPQEVRISDAEIRRTADRVYKIIEDRIHRERRRLGL